jgi:transcriptional regulator with XRE-family HTH domain
MPTTQTRGHRGRAGPLVRERRQAVGRSLLDLATDVGVSTRHLGFVELGRSRPSPELLAIIADRLDVPPRELNDWLIAAGHAPRHSETALDADAMRTVRSSLQAMLDALEPYPAVAVDRCWTAQLWNASAVWLADGVPTVARGDPTNMFRISLHPDGFSRRTRNFADWSRHMLHQLDLIVRRTRDPRAVELAAEVETWPGIAPRPTWSRWVPPEGEHVLPWVVEHGGVELSLFSVMATLGTPVDLTLSELTVELFLPADAATAVLLQRRP